MIEKVAGSMQLIQQAELMEDARDAPSATTAVAPRVLSATMTRPLARTVSGEEWHSALGQAFGQAGGLFLTLHNSPPGSIAAVDPEPRSHSACLQFMPFSFGALFQMVRIIREQKIDIVMWHFIQPLTHPYVWALSILCPRVEHWLTDHVSQSLPLAEPPKPWVTAIKRVILRRYQRVICVSDFVADYLAKRGYTNIVTNYMFVNCERLKPDLEMRVRIRRELNLGDRFAILFAGHMIREKGGRVALEALSKLPQDAVLVVVGDGPALQELQDAAREIGVSDRVQFLGRKSDVAPYMQACDVSICPSLWAEAAGLVNMEAQACGLPVVASRVGGIPEVIEDGVSGLLFEVGNAEALAAALTVLKNDADLRRRMGEAGRERALAKFSSTARVPIYLNHYIKSR